MMINISKTLRNTLLLSIGMILSATAFAHDVEQKYLVQYDRMTSYAYNTFLDNQPIVSFSDHEESLNLNYVYYTKMGYEFNLIPYRFFFNHTEKLNGFDDFKGNTFKDIYNFQELYDIYINTGNPISKRKALNKFISNIRTKGSEIKNLGIFENSYYADVKIKKVKRFNSQLSAQSFVIDYNLDDDKLDFYCNESGLKYAVFNPSEVKVNSKLLTPFVKNTPIYIELPIELKSKLSFYPNNKDLPLCEYTENFLSLDKAENYINFINNNLNKFVLKIKLIDNKETSYLNAKAVQFGLTVYDGNKFNKPYVFYSGETYNEYSDVLYSEAKAFFDIKPNYELTVSSLTNGYYSYSIGLNYYLKIIDNKKAVIFNSKNRLLVEYDYELTKTSLTLNFSRIIRESGVFYPREVIIYKKFESTYKSYILFNMKDSYIELDADLQKNLVFDFDKLMKIN